MKVAERVLEVDSTLTGERVAMGIDSNALAHIMSVLTDLYSNPVLAVIREYSTNAYDSHIEAGVTRPIEVTLPTHLAPFFRVRDFGEGLSAEDIRDIYSKYGASTKRESNDVVGMLGLGCKSALTYTDQFTLTGIKDGVMTQVSVSRDANGSGSMVIVDQFETDRPSGVEVIVPVKAHHNFEEEATNFFRFWKPGTVLVNGQEPKRIDGVWLTDKIVMCPDLDESYIVMGNVAYPYDDGNYSYNSRSRHTATFVEIGTVNFTPSREQLQMTPLTQKTLAEVKQTIKKEEQAAFAREVESAPDRVAALAKYHEVEVLGYNEKNPTWHGEAIPTMFESDDPKKPYSFLSYDGNSRGHGHHESKLYAKGSLNFRWFEGFTSNSMSPYKRKKLEKWMSDNSMAAPRTWIMTDKIPNEVKKWIDPSRIHDWTVVDAIKLPANAPRQDGRPTGSYNVVLAELESSKATGVLKTSLVRRSKDGVEAADLDTTKPIYWVTKQEYYPAYLKLTDKVHPKGYTVVILGLNRINKFERDFPMAKRLKNAVRDLAEKWAATLTDEDKMYLRVMESDHARMLKNMDETNIDDPELVEAIRVAKTKNQTLHNTYNEFSGYIAIELAEGCPTDKYPLLDSIGYYGYNENKDHIAIYINAVYAAGQEA